MRIETLRYILEVAQKKSINKVAQESFISRQQLSYIIREAEKELNTTLFERTSNRLLISDESKELFEDIERIVTTYDHLLSLIQKPTTILTGNLKLAVNSNIWSSGIDIPQEFSRLYPEVGLSIHSMSCEDIIKRLSEKRYHIALFNQATLNGQDCYHIPDSFMFEPVIQLPTALYVSENFDVPASGFISLQDVVKLPLINYKPFESNDTLVRKLLSNFADDVNIKYESSDSRLVFNLLEENRGVFLSSYNDTTVQSIASRQIRALPVKDKCFYSYGLLYEKEALSSPEVQAFRFFFLSHYHKKAL